MSNPSDFIIENGVLKKYTGPGGDVVIPEGVTRIGTGAFRECGSLASVRIPTGVRYVGAQAFSYCTGLTEVLIPEGVKEIWYQAFQSCRGLKTLIIPESVTEIGDEAFANCENLTEATLPAGLETAGKACFSSCDRLEIERVQNWTPAISALLGKNKIKRIIAEDFSSVPAARKLSAVLGYLSERRNVETGEIDERIRVYLEKNARKLSAAAFDEPELLTFLCDLRLIPAADVEAFQDEAEKRGDTEKKALLLGYQNRLDSGSVAKARARQEKVKESYMSAALERAAARDPAKGMEGMTFVVGGKLSVWDSRKDLQAYLESYGAKLASSVTKQTDYLVAEESDNSSEKTLKARKLGVTIIDEAEFNQIIGKRFKDAVSIEVPIWLKRIESFTFYRCPSLTTVSISKGVMSISGWSFYDLAALTKVTIPESVTSINGNMFVNCPNVSIHAPVGSYAEQYAKAHNIPFVAE